MLHLAPMTEAEFKIYYDAAVADYAQEHMRGGRWSAEEAYENSASEYQALLPAGVETPDNYLYTLRTDEVDGPVGILWFAIRNDGGKRTAFVYDVRIDPAFQRRGYATLAFRALEQEASGMGLHKIALHVFGHNKAARALYEKLGYEPTNIILSKSLAAAAANQS
ncbi:MAG: GNAT family N-acetyltransferase [Chloroflexi bacterium]|nr:GNAT family N-acetyltransferase [Chloroflexota bacterium]